jgi:hypothetical protein
MSTFGPYARQFFTVRCASRGRQIRGSFLPKQNQRTRCVKRLLRAGRRFELFGVLVPGALVPGVLGSWVIGAGMQCKLLVALPLEIFHRFVERLARGRARSVENPGAFGATPTPKTPLFDPYQLPSHGTPRLPRPQALRGAQFTCANLDGLSGILHTWKILPRVRPISAWFEVTGTA